MISSDTIADTRNVLSGFVVANTQSEDKLSLEPSTHTSVQLVQALSD